MDTQVLIIGGGIGGLTLAAICKKTGISCMVLERSAELTAAGAGISLAPNALHALDQLGLTDTIATEGQPLRKLRVFRNQTLYNTIDYGWVEADFGHPVYSIERRAFHRMLYDAADGAHTVILGACVESIEELSDPSGVRASLADGRQFTAEFVVGADGIRSIVRRQLHGSNTLQFTGRVHIAAYTAPIAHLGQDDVGVAHWMIYDDAVLSTYPCGNKRQWLAGAKAGDPKNQNRSVWKGADKNTLYDQYGEYYHPFAPHTKVRELIDQVERVIVTDVYEESTFPTMAKGRIALIGDAAHAMTSFFGQGGCQAVEDATELANILHQYFTNTNTASLEELLVTYCQNRGRRTKDIAQFSASFARIVTAKLPFGLGPFVRWCYLRWMPSWGWSFSLKWLYGYQPNIDALH